MPVRHLTVVNATADLSKAVPDIFVESVFIDALRRNVFIATLGRPSTLPDSSGKRVRWNILVHEANFYNDVTANINATGTNEGNDPTLVDFTLTSPEVTLLEYGRSFEYSKFLQKAAVSGTTEEIADELGHQAAAIIDRVCAKALAATTQSTDEGLAMTAEALRKAVSKLEVGVTPDFAGVPTHPASPGGGQYIAIFSAEQSYDMLGEGAPTWFQAKSDLLRASLVKPFQDASSSELYNAIIRKSNNVPRVTTPTPDDDQGFVIGKDALLTAALDTNVIQPRLIMTPPDANVAAPARNRGFIAWWALFNAVLSENIRVQEILTDASGIG